MLYGYTHMATVGVKGLTECHHTAVIIWKEGHAGQPNQTQPNPEHTAASADDGSDTS